jgi:hypothetical protein
MISLPNPHCPVPMTTVRTYQHNGPYFSTLKGCYQASSLKEVVFHVRLAMEDQEDIIGIFDHEGSCKGIWHREIEGYVDSAGDSIIDHEGYELMRPRDSWTWNHLLEQVK